MRSPLMTLRFFGFLMVEVTLVLCLLGHDITESAMHHCIEEKRRSEEKGKTELFSMI